MNINSKRFPRNEYYKKLKEDVFACKADGQDNGHCFKENPMRPAMCVCLKKGIGSPQEVKKTQKAKVKDTLKWGMTMNGVITTSFHLLGRNAPIGRSLYINKFEKEYTTCNAYI